MDRAGLGYERRDNCFARLDSVEKAQELMDRQLELAWPKELTRIARLLNPAHGRIFKGTGIDYYWSVYQSEWATDLMFEDAASLAEVSQASNERYLEALAAVDSATPFGDLLTRASRPATWNGARVRGLRPWDADDLALVRAISRGEFCVNGFRNRDLQPILFDTPPSTPAERKRRSARVSRKLRLLRAHGLVRKLPKSHRYRLSERGRQLATALLAAHDLSLEQINKAAA